MPTLSFPMVFGLIMSAAVFLVVLGIAQARRAAGGSEDFQACVRLGSVRHRSSAQQSC